jgi:hypothetical protein
MATSYSNVGGSGDRRTPVIGSSTGITFTGGNISALLDGITGSGTLWFSSNFAAAGCVMEFDFRYPAIIDEAKWYQSTSATHGTWKWQGSNNGSSWTDIGSSFTLGGASPQTQTQLNGNTTAYRYYRLLGVSGNVSSAPYLREIEFKITYNANAVTPAYGNPLSLGDRTATITLTSDVAKSGGNYTDLINGSYAGTLWFSGGAVAGHYIKFDFGVDKIISEAIWYQTAGATTQGVWKWQGSADGSNWFDIGSSFTLGDWAQVQTQLNGNTTAYRYYRLLGISGNTSTVPFDAEIDFCIGAGAVAQTLSPTGIPSEETFGTPVIGLVLSPTGIPSQEAFGTPVISMVLSPTGIPSEEAFGTPGIGLVLSPTGIPSQEAFGTPSLLVGPEPCRSLSRCEALALPPADCRSLTTCAAIGAEKPADCRSLTTCDSLGLNRPDPARSLTLCRDISLKNGGLFTVF